MPAATLPVKASPKDHDYTKCYEMLVQMGVELTKIIVDITSSNIPGLIVAIVELVKESYDVAQCFIHNAFPQMLERSISRVRFERRIK